MYKKSTTVLALFKNGTWNYQHLLSVLYWFLVKETKLKIIDVCYHCWVVILYKLDDVICCRLIFLYLPSDCLARYKYIFKMMLFLFSLSVLSSFVSFISYWQGTYRYYS